LVGTQPSSDLAESIRIVLDARSVETAKAISSGHRRAVGSHRELDEALTHVQWFLDELIRKRRTDTGDQDDMLSLLLRVSQLEVSNGKSKSQADRQVRDETIGMINASLDATAAAMTWTLCLVAKHPTVQARLRQEVESRLTGRSPMEIDCAELPFSEMVVHESLRLYPPNWVLIMRRCIRESILGGHRIPRGSWLYIFPYVTHRDPSWFPAPESFNPDRFAPEVFGPEQRSAYIPLGLGPHVCIGKALSTILLTSILARILREFRIELPIGQTDVEPEVGIVLRPKIGLQLSVTREEAG
jgi:cytochrome P450